MGLRWKGMYLKGGKADSPVHVFNWINKYAYILLFFLSMRMGMVVMSLLQRQTGISKGIRRKHTWRGIPTHYANMGGFVSSTFFENWFQEECGATQTAYTGVKAEKVGFSVWGMFYSRMWPPREAWHLSAMNGRNKLHVSSSNSRITTDADCVLIAT